MGWLLRYANKVSLVNPGDESEHQKNKTNEILTVYLKKGQVYIY